MTRRREELVSAPNLDYPTFTKVQYQVFHELVKAQGADLSYITEEFYRWKYNPPAGSGKTAVIYLDDEMSAVNSMYPFQIRSPFGLHKGWQSCDTATMPQARGQGCFFSCISQLKSSLAQEALFFGFPNQNSKRGFEKLGWSVWREVDTWVFPLVLARNPQPTSLQEFEKFGEAVDHLNLQIASQGLTYLDRNAAYLNWRYLQHPQVKYRIFAWVENEQWLGFVVTREAQVKGRRFLFIMELWSLTPELERALLSACVSVAAQQKLRHVLLFDSGHNDWAKWSSGFLRIPRRFLPKRQLLMGEVVGYSNAPLQHMNWRTQLGDWDAF